MTVPTPSVGQVIDAAAWGAVVATDVNGLLTRATTLESQMAPLQAGLVGTAFNVTLSASNYGMSAGSWYGFGSIDFPAVAYPRIAVVTAATLLTKGSGTPTYYWFRVNSTTGFVGTDKIVQCPYDQSATVCSVYTLAAGTVGQLLAELATPDTVGGVSTSGFFSAGFNYIDAAMIGVRAIV